MRKTIKSLEEQIKVLVIENDSKLERLNDAAKTIITLRKESEENNKKIKTLEMKENRSGYTVEGYLKSINTLLTKIQFIIDTDIITETELKLVKKITSELLSIKSNLDEYYY